jgi:anionic cell wall polymer biosynthesis LytR-Cps2A-Psr (LCP) family protein
MEVDISGFRRMVDAIGGIDVCMPQSIYDSQLNFKLPSGPSHLDGNLALSFVRARYATPDGDFGRIKRQQQFFRSVASKIGRPSVLGNPVKVNGLARAFAQNVKIDQFFQMTELLRFALSVKSISPNQLETYSVPGDVGRIAGQSVVILDPQRDAPLFDAVKNIQDPRTTLAGPATPAPPPTHHTTTGTTQAAGAPASPCPAGPA